MPAFNADQYIDVQERIVRFWREHPEGAIRTRLMSPPDDFTQCRYEAAVYKRAEQSAPDATGWAFELAAPGTRGPNATSHEENCETSAIGRALANMGYATTRQDRPSRQEMAKANRSMPESHQPPMAVQNGSVAPQASPTRPITDAQLKFLIGLGKDLGMVVIGPDGAEHHDEAAMNAAIRQHFGADELALTKLSAQQASALIAEWKARPKVGRR